MAPPLVRSSFKVRVPLSIVGSFLFFVLAIQGKVKAVTIITKNIDLNVLTIVAKFPFLILRAVWNRLTVKLIYI